MATVTVITPTYNRAYKIHCLYESLENQINKDFEWLVVDDGSSDNTKEVIEGFMEKADFSIKYIYKENGGKHTALNVGIPHIDSEMTIIVDSDDTLLPNAVEYIVFYKEKYKNEKDISAFAFLKIFEDGRAAVPLPKDEFVDSYIGYRIKEENPGDMAEVFYTEMLKKYPFPEFKGERFLSEDVVWIEIGKTHRYVFVNKPVYMFEYLEDGLTKSDKPMKFASPLGSMLRGKQLMYKDCGLKVNIKGAIIYNCYRKCVKGKISDGRLALKGREKFLALITKPLGGIFYKKWKP